MPVVINGSGSVTGITTRLAATAAPVGSVIQTVSAQTTTALNSTTVETDHDTNLSGSITTTGSNKVLVIISQNIIGRRTTTGSNSLAWKLQRNTDGAGYSVVYNSGQDESMGFRASGVSAYNYVKHMASLVHLDSPGAGAHTYKTTLYMTGGEVTVKAQEDDHPSTITMMEIAV